MKKQISETGNHIQYVENQTKMALDRNYDLEVQLDELQQYIRRDCLEITGIPIIPVNDNPALLVQEMSTLIGVQLEENDISTAHRLPPTKKIKNRLIVKFTRREKRDEVYKKKEEFEI